MGPGYSTMIQWLSEVWHQLKSVVIVKSFVYCGIGSALSDDLHHYNFRREVNKKKEGDYGELTEESN